MKPSELRAWRTSLNISQTKAAEQFDVTLSQYSKWECGKAPIPKKVDIIINLLTNKQPL